MLAAGGYAPIGGFVLSGDVTFDAVVASPIKSANDGSDASADDGGASDVSGDSRLRGNDSGGDGTSVIAGTDPVIAGTDPQSLLASSESNLFEPLAIVDGNDSLTLKVGQGTGFVDVDDISNAITWPLSITNRQIQITAKFSEPGIAKDRTLTVNVPRGYKIVEYTATSDTSVISGVNKLGLSAEWEAQVAGSVLTARDGSAWASQTISGYTGSISATEIAFRVYDGKVVYTFNSNYDSVDITLTLALDQGIMPHNAATTTLEQLTVEMLSGTKSLSDYLSTTVSELFPTTFRTTAPATNVTGVVDGGNPDLGVIDQFTTYNQIWSYSSAMSAQNHYAESATWTVQYPESVNFQGFKEEVVGQDRPTDAAGGTYANGHLIVTNDTSARTVTFKYSDVRLLHSTEIYCYWTADIDNSVLHWNDTKPFTYTTVVLSGDNANNQQTYTPPSTSVNITFKKPDVKLSLMPTHYVRRDLNAAGTFPYDYALGRFNLINIGPSIPTDITYNFTFSPYLAVRGVSLPADDSATDYQFSVVANTNKRSNVTWSGAISYSSGSDHLSRYLSPNILGLAEDEYLLDLAATQPALPVRSYVSSRYSGGLVYFGRFQSGTSGSVTLSITDSSGTELAKETDSPTIGWTGAGSGAMTSTASHSATSAVTGSYYPGDAIYFTSTYTPGGVLNATYNDIVDPEIYIILPQGVDLDFGSVKVASAAGNLGGVAFTPQFLGSSTKTIDGTDWTMYRFTSPSPQDIITTVWSARQGGRNQFTVKFTANVSSACGTYAELKPKDMVLIDLGLSATNVSDGTDYRVADANDWTGKGTSYMLVGGTISAPLAVVQKPGLNVSLGIRTLGDTGPYFTYNGSESSVAKVSKDKDAQVWLHFENTSTDVYKAGSEIYLPVPKISKTYDHYFNNISSNPLAAETNATPEWSALLTGPISLPGFTTYYTKDSGLSTNYTSGEVANNWVPFTADWSFAPGTVAEYAQVTMVKFVAHTNIASAGNTGSSGETEFTIEIDPSDATNRDKINYWRSYQKGWRDTDGSGSWVFGSVIAARTAAATLKGQIFNDADANGSMDSTEAFTSLSGVRAVLSGTTISPINITVNANGTFALLNGTNTAYLSNGDYTLTVYNDTYNLGTASQFGFGKTSSATRSNEVSPGNYAWYMDVAQTNISDTHALATFPFTVSATTEEVELVGVGLHTAARATYTAGTGASFSTLSEYRNNNQHPSAGIVPVFSAGGNIVAGYDPATAVWKADEEVTLTNGDVISAGTAMTRAQVLAVKVVEDVTFTASLTLKDYTVVYDNGYSASASVLKTESGKNIDGTVTPPGDPNRTGYVFGGWAKTKGGSAESDYRNAFTLNAIAINDLFAEDTTAAATLYAVWTARTDIGLIFNANGGVGTPLPLTGLEFDKTLSGQSPPRVLPGVDSGAPTRVGYSFAGWSTESGVSNTSNFTEANTVNWTGDKTVYAVWTANLYSYTITHHFVGGPNNGTSSGVFSGTALFGQMIVAPTDTVYPGYTHNAAHPSAVLTGVVGADGLALHLYYQAIPYVITFDANGGELNTGGNILFYPNIDHGTLWSASGITVPTAALSGYTFIGWSPVIPDGSTAITANATYTAQWTYNPPPPPPTPPTPPPVIVPVVPVVPPPVVVVETEPEQPVPPVPPAPTPPAPVAEIPEPQEPETPTYTDISVSYQEQLDAQTGNLFRDLANGNVPLGSFFGNGAWSLLSLILSLIAVLFALLLLIRIAAKRREHKDAVLYEGEETKEKEERRRYTKALQITTIVIGVLTLIVWLILDDLSLPMVWINKWTIFVAVVFLVHIIFLAVYRYNKAKEEKEDEEDGETEGSQPMTA
ncbi:hypothetical protein AGMMS49983_11960 [Clostridia bacterium]|nr:hypothetical protein AGMMS49983_11960 [Clostridia bacterium]